MLRIITAAHRLRYFLFFSLRFGAPTTSGSARAPALCGFERDEPAEQGADQSGRSCTLAANGPAGWNRASTVGGGCGDMVSVRMFRVAHRHSTLCVGFSGLLV